MTFIKAEFEWYSEMLSQKTCLGACVFGGGVDTTTSSNYHHSQRRTDPRSRYSSEDNAHVYLLKMLRFGFGSLTPFSFLRRVSSIGTRG